jgi:hypothetical protein
MTAGKYRIKIVQNGVEFEAEGDKAFVVKMLNHFDEGKLKNKTEKSLEIIPPSKEAKGTRTQHNDSSKKNVSVGEFIRQIGVKKHTDIVLAFGYYLEKHSGATEFTPADINACYYDAKMESSNTSQMIIQNIRSSKIMEAKNSESKKKSYVLTNTGIEFIESKINKQSQ